MVGEAGGAVGLVLTCVLLLPVCAGGQSPDAGAEVGRRDSAGVEFVTVPGRLVADAPEWRLADQPLLTVRGDELDGFPLSEIQGGVILPADRIAIADGVVDRVAIVSFDGELLRTFGRVGEGPAEYSDIDDLRRRAGDELAVWDGNASRIVVFDTAGAFVEMVRPPAARTAQRALSFPGFLRDGSIVFQRKEGFPRGNRDRPVGRHRIDFMVDRYEPDGAWAALLAEIPGLERIGAQEGRSWAAIGVPLAGRPHLAVAGGAAVVGHGERFVLRMYGPRGLERVVTVDRPRRAVTAPEREAARDSAVARWDRLPFRRVDLPMKRTNPIDRNVVEVSDSFPAFEDLHADPDGRLWIRETPSPLAPSARREGAACCSWVILGGTGTPRGRLRVPQGLRILDTRGDLLLGYEVDELDVPRVVLHRIDGMTR